MQSNSKDLFQVEKGKQRFVVVFPSSIKREFRNFRLVVVLQGWQRNVSKRLMNVESSCFA